MRWVGTSSSGKDHPLLPFSLEPRSARVFVALGQVVGGDGGETEGCWESRNLAPLKPKIKVAGGKGPQRHNPSLLGLPCSRRGTEMGREAMA